MSSTVSKTFRLTPKAVSALQELVCAGRARTQTALIEWLISRERARLTMEQEDRDLDEAWEKAMSCAQYREEIGEMEAAFAEADSESSRMIQ